MESKNVQLLFLNIPMFCFFILPLHYICTYLLHHIYLITLDTLQIQIIQSGHVTNQTVVAGMLSE